MKRESLPQVLAIFAVAVLVLLGVFLVADWVASSTVQASARVLGRQHVAAYTSWHVVTTFDGKHSHSHLSPHYHPEQWTVVVSKDGKALSAQATATTYSRAEVGQSVPIQQRIGGFSGSVLSTWLE